MYPQPRPSSRRQSSMRAAATYNHSRRLCGIASRCWRNANGKSVTQASEATLFKVFEQPDRAGSPRHQVQNPTYARLQELPIGRYHDRWSGTTPSHSQRSIRLEETEDQKPSGARDLECCACRVKNRMSGVNHFFRSVLMIVAGQTEHQFTALSPCIRTEVAICTRAS